MTDGLSRADGKPSLASVDKFSLLSNNCPLVLAIIFYECVKIYLWLSWLV